MVKFIIGKKGSGKTKQLLDSVHEAVATDKGHIVFINEGNRHIFDLDHKVRLIETKEYSLSSYQALYGFLCGIMSQDYDISSIFIDSITKVVVGDDLFAAEATIASVAQLCEKNNIRLTVTASVEPSEAPEFLKKYL